MCIWSLKKKSEEICPECQWVCEHTWKWAFEVKCRICGALIDTLLWKVIKHWNKSNFELKPLISS